MNGEIQVNRSKFRVELGRKGEKLAADFLKSLDYTILKRNCRIGHSDIDILAKDKDTLVFVEVRTRSRKDRGMPEETLSTKKLRRMKRTAEIYLSAHNHESTSRLDAVCIVIDEFDKIRHFKHYKGIG